MADKKRETLRLADALESDKWHVPAVVMQRGADELRRLAGVEAECEALRALLADDAFAASFQTMAQYRSALLKSVREPT